MLKKESSVYLLAGSEQFVKAKNISRIKSAVLDEKSGSFNFNIFYGDSASAKEVLECASTLPFLGKRRLVLVYHVEEFSASDKEGLLSYIKDPQESTCLILETEEDNLKFGFFAQVSNYAKVIFCAPLSGSQTFSWIRKELKWRGKKIEDKAQRLLFENLGNNLESLSSALDTLILYIGKKDTIQVEDVEKLVGPDLSTTAFELFRAVFARKKKRAFLILDSLFKDGVNCAQILGAFTHQLISERNRISSAQFDFGLEQIQRTDADIKRGRQGPRMAVELLLTKLLHFF